MTPTSQDDELLSILLVSLRNAAATFGEDSPSYKDILATVEQHVQSMKASGKTTNISQLRQGTSQHANAQQQEAPAPAALSFGSLAFRPKPQS